MAGTVRRNLTASRAKSWRGAEESPLAKWTLVAIAGLFCLIFLLLPLANVFAQAFSKGWEFYHQALINPNSLAAIRLTLIVAAISMPLNVLFGLAASWAIAKFEFPGKALLITLIDLPFSVSPVVAGLMFVVLFGLHGFFGEWLSAHDIKIIFAVPGIVLATLFVTFPFVARELIPVMQAAGMEQEEAALTLGANGWQTFWRVTVPNVKWGLIYGIILCNARAMGEYGAVYVVSGNVIGSTETMSLRIGTLNSDFQGQAAFAVASLLALLALVTLGLKTLLEWQQVREFTRSQRALADVAEAESKMTRQGI